MRKVEVKMGILRSLLMMQAFFDLSMLPVIFQFISLKYLNRFKKGAQFFSGSIIISMGLTGFLGLTFMALFTSIFVSSYIPYMIALIVVFYLLVSSIGHDAVLDKISSFIKRINRRLKSKFINLGLKYITNLKRTRSFLSQRDIIIETASFIPMLFFENAMLYFTLLAFNQTVSIFNVIFFFSLADIIGILSFLPLSIGALDLSFIGFMAALGVPGVIGLSTILIYRLFMNVIMPVFGYICLLLLDIMTAPNKRRHYS
jgi:hypothetical protein